jgi:xylose dehydrogenase (NAD/NADP)
MAALRFGVLSTANINGMILAGAAASEQVDVVAVASRDAARAQAYAADHGIPRSHGSYEALLADSEIDAVYVSLPNRLHHEWTMRALVAGKHVLCEKPYSRRPDEVDEAFDEADRQGLVLMEGFMYRHHPQTLRVTELVAGGAIGRLRFVRASFSFRLDDDTNVRARPELDGGALMDIGCYCVSGSRLLAGEPEQVAAEQVVGPTGVDVALAATLRFPDDVVSLIDCSFLLPRTQRLEAEGEEGSLVVDAPWRVDWGGDVVLHRGGETTREVVDEDNSYTLELDDFAQAVAGGSPRIGRADVLGQARAIDALYRAAGEGRSVRL